MNAAAVVQYADGVFFLLVGAVSLLVGYRVIGPGNTPTFSADAWYARHGRTFRLAGWVCSVVGAALTLRHLPD